MDVQQLFKNLKKEAECPLCSETVKEPKTLPCLHSFCLNCLDKHAGHARRRQKEKLKCPVCPTEFNVPKGDTFSDFPTSFHLNRLVDVLAINDSDADMQTCRHAIAATIAALLLRIVLFVKAFYVQLVLTHINA